MARTSDLLAAGAQLGEYGFQPLLLDRAHAVGGHAQRNPALLGLEPETLCMQIRQETPPPLVVGVRDGIARDGALAGDLTDAGHELHLTKSMSYKCIALAQCGRKGRFIAVRDRKST